MQSINNNFLRYADDKCGYCLDDYDPNNNHCLALRCGHLFHTKCMKEYLNSALAPVCPLCQSRITYIPNEALKYAAKVAFIMTAIFVALLSYIRFKEDTCPALWYDTCPDWATKDCDFTPNARDDDFGYIAICGITVCAIFSIALWEPLFDKWYSRDESAKEINYRPQSKK